MSGAAAAPVGAAARGARGGRLRGALALGVAFALSGAVILWLRAVGGPAALAARWGVLGTALWVPLQVLVNLSPMSDFVPCAILNGSLYGLWRGTALSWCVWLVAASLEFAIGRRAGLDFDLESRREAMPRWLRDLPIHHPAVLVVGHWVPVSSSLVNLAAGALGVPYRRLLACTAVAMVPPAVASAAIGAGLLGAVGAL